MEEQAKRSSRKVIKSHEVDDTSIGFFSLVEIGDSEEEENQEALQEGQNEPSDEPVAEAESDSGEQDDYQAGYDEGYREGYDKGYKDGYKEGLKKGYQEGFSKGEKEGFDKGHEEGLSRGYEEGLERGKQEGFSEGKSEGRRVVEDRYREILKRAERSLELFDGLCSRLDAFLKEAEDHVVEVVILAMQKLFFHVPPENVVKNTVSELMRRLSDVKRARLRVNPKDMRFLEELTFPEGIEVVEDASLKRGEMVAETETGSLEVSLEKRLRDFEEMVLKGVSGE